MGIEDKKLILLEDTKKFFEENGRFPSNKEVEKEMGVPRRTLRRYFGSLSGLVAAAMEHVEEPLFTVDRANKAKKAITKHKRFFVTTAVVGAEVFDEALASVKNYCKREKAQLLVLPCADPSASVSEGLDEKLLEEIIVFQALMLNSNIGISDIKTSAKQINPATGLRRIGQRNKSTIFASPKQNLEYCPVSNHKIPHALMTTGAITKPAYQTNRYMSLRTAFLAEQDHVLGGIIVEVVNDKIYHFRQVQFNADGSFTDLGLRYFPNKVKESKIIGLVLGDWHSTHTDPVVRTVTHRMMEELNPEQVVLHDLHQGDSTNHWLEDKSVTRARLKIPTIKEELEITYNEVFELSKRAKKTIVVKSNHDIWLDRYLEAGKFIKDSRNYRIALDLAAAMFDGKDVLEFGLGLIGPLKNITFLKEGDDHIIGKTQCGSHGEDMTLAQLENAYNDVIAGHSHTAGILRKARKVGTSTKLRESYTRGRPLSWTQTHAVINEDNSVQLVNIIDGNYRL